MNLDGDGRGSAGINILWPIVDNSEYQNALQSAYDGHRPNNISPIIRYSLNNGATVLSMGDLETGFVESIQHAVDLQPADILFAAFAKSPTLIGLIVCDPQVYSSVGPGEHIHRQMRSRKKVSAENDENAFRAICFTVGGDCGLVCAVCLTRDWRSARVAVPLAYIVSLCTSSPEHSVKEALQSFDATMKRHWRPLRICR